jgi:hypothetical protein
MRTRWLVPVLVSGLLTTWAGISCGGTVVVAFDQARDSIWVEWCGHSVPVDDGGRVRIPPGQSIRVEVRSTNTALYTYSVAASESESATGATLQSYLPTLKGYLTDLPEVSLSQKAKLAGSTPAPSPGDAALAALAGTLDSLEAVEILALQSLSRMAGTGSAGIGVEAERFRAETETLLWRPGDRLKLAEILQQRLERLNDLVLADSLSGTPMKTARGFLAGAPTLMKRALQVEAEVAAVRDAHAVWSKQMEPLSAMHARTLKVSVRHRTEPALAALARTPDRTVTVRLEPRWPVQPAVGVALVVAPKATYPTYTIDRSGAQPTVVRTGESDDRFTYGLSLALTPSRLYQDQGWSLWLVDLTLNPSSNLRAVGLGSAVSWNILKLSGGILWTKHGTPSAGAVEDTYGRGKGYVALSLAGWLK